MSQAEIEALLQDKIGLDSQIIGSQTIARAIKRKMSDCGLSDLTIYLQRLKTSTHELNDLIEEVVVPETWFFRDRKPFDFLKQYLKTEWLPNHTGQKLRVLSVPCSTGEEPYSIAITLLEAGLIAENFYLKAVDINKKSLLIAQHGVYTKNSFRGGITSFQKRYFKQTEAIYQLDQSIIKTVEFSCCNLLDPYFLKGDLPYHIIFCRNLLIYLKQSARTKVMQVLSKLLHKNGLLFLGCSETIQILPNKFVPVRHPIAFAFRKESEQKSPDVLSKSFPSTQPFVTKDLVKKSQLSFLKSAQTKDCNSTIPNSAKINELPKSEAQPLNSNSPSILEIARTLADQGQLEQAAELCKTDLQENPRNAEAYFLLGQVHQALGNEKQAEQDFQKALYLEPNYYEVLVFLTLLKEHQGDQKSAAILRERIQRLL